MRISLVLATAALVAGFVALAMAVRPVVGATLPPNFEDQLLASASKPTALAFTPDGRMLIATQPGQLRVYKNGQLLQNPALNISGKICTNSERGLLGVAVDPSFSTNKYVYLYYTYNKFGVCPTGQPTNANNPVNRVSRFVMSGDTVDPASEMVLIDNIPSPNGNHNAGDLHFGKDGYLYVTVGDGGCDYKGDSGCAGANDASRDRHILLGKVLRITRDGGIPSTNPFTDASSARCNLTGRTDPGKNCQETFAWGLRNPFRFAFDPDAAGTRFFINDVGQAAWEEVDQGQAGADYAWNLCEGTHDNPNRAGSVDCAAAPYTPPVHEYSHSNTGCASVTGGAFVPNGVWPDEYDDSYLLGDYVCNKIFKLTPVSGGGFARTEFASGLGGGGPTAMAFGPNGSGKALYYTTYANGGEVHRISFAGGNQSPIASVKTTTPNYGPIPLTVSFDGSASNDPDGDTPLTYIWDFGDGSVPAETTTPSTSHTYNTTGTYTAELKVRDASGALSAPATIKVFPGNTPPEPTIESPAPTKLFKVGEQITLRGSASDAEDGPLADSTLSWEVRQHHNGNHWHPFFSATGTNLMFNAPPPEDLLSTGVGNHLEIRLTATDSKGLSKTITQDLQPNRVNVTFESNPSGLSLGVNGTTFTAPRTFVAWEGYKLNVNAPSPQTLGGTTYVFRSWSDGGAQSHDVITGAQSSTYTATFDTATAVAGLKGEYYDNQDLTNLKLTRIDPTINFSWGQGSPDPLIGPDTFSVRWSGQIKADHTETYTFYATTNDGVRLWVDNKLVINRWSDGATTNTGTIALEAGKWYPIKMEHYEGVNNASAKLEYSSVSIPRQVVPSSHLLTTAPADAIAPTVTSTVPGDGATGVAVTANVEAAFSEAMDAQTINGTTFTLLKQGTTTPINAAVSYDGTTKKATLDPSANLDAGATYTATIKGGSGGVKDLAGNALAADKSWSFTTATAQTGTYTLLVSSSADRSNPTPLAGKTVSGNIYAFTSPGTGVLRVRFYLDDPNMSGTPRQIENNAPHDFAGGSASTANPFNTATVSNGSHTITAAVEKSGGGTEVVHASFTVSN